jgi:hypothetical protein
LVNQHANAGVVFTIWKDGANRETDAPVAKLKAQNKGGSAEVKWRYIYNHDPENPLTEKPKFVFTVNSYRCAAVASANIEWGMNINLKIINDLGKPLKNIKYKLIGPDGIELEL